MMPSGSRGGNYFPYISNSYAIRQEIQRFESVHPSIYAIYDLIDYIHDPALVQQIREHVVCIEDSFVNSQEWTLSRSVPDLRLGIVGSLSSGKSALVHRYLTGSYMQEESPEGGRFKKEVVVDGQSYLLLIRDEGGPPELQFTSWVDAIVFVFSLENDNSFSAIYNYYAKMAQFRNLQDVPLILVGTQDAIGEKNPRIIEESRARKLSTDLNRCAYYETCATYGLNVERVFQDACQKIVQLKSSNISSPMSFLPRNYSSNVSSPSNGYANTNVTQQSPVLGSFNQEQRPGLSSSNSLIINPTAMEDFRNRIQDRTERFHNRLQDRNSMPNHDRLNVADLGGGGGVRMWEQQQRLLDKQDPAAMNSSGSASGDNKDTLAIGELPTPSSTPTSVRKNRRRSNLFTPGKTVKSDDKKGPADKLVDKGGGEVGSGRSIPVRQGYLYKKSNKSFSKDWKKKYVALSEDGRMTYYPSLHDYMENVHGKDIPLQCVTVKVPGQGPRGMRTVPVMGNSGIQAGNNSTSTTSILSDNTVSASGISNSRERVTLTGFEVLREVGGGASGGEEGENTGTSRDRTEGRDGKTEQTTPNVKKRHRRVKSSNVKGGQAEDEECWEFQIVSLDNKTWHFEAGSLEERDHWIQAIEAEILNSLQGNQSSKSKAGGSTSNVDNGPAISRIQTEVAGNSKCVDCESLNPDWASLNLGVLVCIECSGIHRNLGSHISRVRSLNLDEWPPGHLAVMLSLGNQLANSIWEHNITQHHRKPNPSTPREEKERYIKAKYERKEFLKPLTSSSGTPAQNLIDSVCRSDTLGVSLALAHCGEDEVNTVVSPRDTRTPLHLAAALGHLPISQLLIWANCKLNQLDNEGRSCLTHARNSGAKEVCDLLVSAGCMDSSSGGTLPRRRGSVSGIATGKPQGRSKEVASSVL